MRAYGIVEPDTPADEVCCVISIKTFRLPLIALGGLSLLAAIWDGLVRMDWNLPIPNLSFPEAHGPLMIVGFLGKIIRTKYACGQEAIKLKETGAPVDYVFPLT